MVKNQFISINIVEIKIIHICALILEGMENQVERLLITVSAIGMTIYTN